MADIKISQLGAAASVGDSDVFPIVQDGVTVKASIGQVKGHSIGNTDISDIGDGTVTGAISSLDVTRAKRADIATVETSTASKTYYEGDQFYLSGVLYEALTTISSGTAWSSLTLNTDYKEADDVTSQIQTLANSIGSVSSALANLKDDLTDIDLTGSTNSTGSTILKGTFFYLNGSLVKAKTDIANGATLTANTNYEVVTAGSLNQTKQYTLPLNATKIYSPFNSAEYSALTWEYTATRDCTAVVSINNAQSQNSGNGSMFLIVSIDNINIFTQSVTFGNNAIPDYSFNRAFACNLAKGQKIKVTREANNVTGQYFSVANGIYV